MTAKQHKLIDIAQVLASMPEPARLRVVQEILPSAYAIVPRESSAGIHEAFHATARKHHQGLKTRLAFETSALPLCWRAMVERAEQDVARVAD
jgi:hypothetical protein